MRLPSVSAWSCRRSEQAQTGGILRPIMLLQAQARSQHKETLTVEVVRKTLINDFQYP